MSKTILLVGGGTGGHIYPLRSVADEFLRKKWDVQIVLNDAELDRKISQEIFGDVVVHFLKTKKIRRYFDWRNFTAPIGILKSLWETRNILQKSEPNALFLKGGFVSFPLLFAAKFLNLFRKSQEKIRIFSHESDTSAGVITRICRNFSDKIFESFGAPGYPLFFEDKEEVDSCLRRNEGEKKKNLLVFGGSQGSQFINELIEKNLTPLLKDFSITLITGTGKSLKTKKIPGFFQTEMMEAQNLRKKIYESDLIISRAGANSLFEILKAKKPSIIIPLPTAARDHQTKNARFFADQKLCYLLEEKNPEKFLDCISEIQKDSVLKKNLEKSNIKNAAPEICEEVLKFF